jgi:hypothetical protein
MDSHRPGVTDFVHVRGVVDRVREAGWETVGDNTFLLCYVRGPKA